MKGAKRIETFVGDDSQLTCCLDLNECAHNLEIKIQS